MNDQKIIFGTDGWRALLDTAIHVESIGLVAQAFADYSLHREKRPFIAIAFDGRRDSELFAQTFAGILAANGCKVDLADKVLPTPVLSFHVKHNGADAGVMITASHNPGQYNGVKFKQSNGGPFFTEETKKVEELIGRNPVRKASGEYTVLDMWPAYRKHVESLIDFDAIQKSGLEIAIDSMSGAGLRYLENLLAAHGIKAVTIDGEAKPDFGGRLAEPIEQNLEPLSELLQKGGYALGVATDGDADRLGVMQDTGDWMNIQETILYLAEFYVQKAGGGDLVKTLSVTNKMGAFARPHRLHDVQVGFKYVAEAMLESDAVFGAEESGGFGFRGHLPDRDGIFSALVFIEMLAKSGHKTLSEFIVQKRKEHGEVAYARIDMHEHREDRVKILPRMAVANLKEVAGFNIEGTTTHQSSRGIINSLKFNLEGEARWLLLRSSETEPMVRIYAEGQNMGEVEALLQAGKMLSETV